MVSLLVYAARVVRSKAPWRPFQSGASDVGRYVGPSIAGGWQWPFCSSPWESVHDDVSELISAFSSAVGA